MKGVLAIKPKKLRVSNAARADLGRIFDHIAKDSETAAERFIKRLTGAMQRIADLGHSGVSREWVRPGLRMHVLGSYCIYFRQTTKETQIVRVVHSAMDIDAIIFDGEPE